MIQDNFWTKQFFQSRLILKIKRIMGRIRSCTLFCILQYFSSYFSLCRAPLLNITQPKINVKSYCKNTKEPTTSDSTHKKKYYLLYQIVYTFQPIILILIIQSIDQASRYSQSHTQIVQCFALICPIFRIGIQIQPITWLDYF